MKPVPISNKIANQWNEFLDYFNEKAYNILPKNGDKPKWELLDTNQGWDNLGYSGGQDFYQKVLDEFKTSKGYTASDDLTLEQIPVIQKHFDELANTVQSDPEYFNNTMLPMLRNVSNSGDRKMEVIYNPEDMGLYNSSTNQVNTSFASSGNINPTGWVGSKSRLMRLPFKDLSNSAKSDKNVTTISKGQFVPASFDQGEPFYRQAKFGVINTMEYGGRTNGKVKYEDGGIIPPSEKNESNRKLLNEDILDDESARFNTIIPKEKQKEFDLWVEDRKKAGRDVMMDMQDYDVQGYWLGTNGETDQRGHGSGFYKKPNHPTFDIQGKYATGQYKKYAGEWKGNKYYASPLNFMTKNSDFLKRYWTDAESEGGADFIYPDGTSFLKNNPKAMENAIVNKMEAGGKTKGEADFKEISDENVKIEGPSHEEGGVELSNGDEVRGEETMNVKKGMVFSASLINPETNNPFAKDHEALAKQMKEVEGRTEKWAVKKLGVLKEKEHELFEKQQALNGNNGEGEMEDGGLTDGDPPAKAKSKVPQIRYFVANGESYEVNPKKYDQFIKEFPDAKEYEKLSDNTFVEATSPLAKAGQKKNEPLSKAATTTKSTVKPTISAADESNKPGSSTITDLDLDKIKAKLPTLLSEDVTPTLDVNEKTTVDYFKNLNKEIADKTKELQNGGYNLIVEEGIQEKNKGFWGDFYINEANPEVEKIKEEYGDNYGIVKIAALKARENDNYLVANMIIPYLKQEEENILTSARIGSRTSKGDTNVFRENIQETSAFKDKVDYYLDNYKGMKIKRPDGTILDTDNITASQRDEIRQEVSNMYQVKNAMDVGFKNTKEKVLDAVNGVNLDDPEVAFIKEQGIDKGIIPLSEDQWGTYAKVMDEVSTEYAPIIANADKLITAQTEIFKQSYENDIAEFTNLMMPEVEKFKADLEAQLANNLITEDEANKSFDLYKAGIAEKESQIYGKWNAKIQKYTQDTIKELDNGIKEETRKKLKGTLFENIDPATIDEEMINNSIKAFTELTMSRVDLKMTDNADYLKKMAATSWDKLDWQTKFAQEGLRGSLQTVEGLTGIMSFSGGFETMNIINDYIDDYNLKAPKKELGHFTVNSLLDPDYWWQTYAPMFGQQLVMAPLTFIGGGVGGKIVSKVGLTGMQAALAQGTVAQLAQRPLTAFVNAGSYYTELRNSGMGELEAGELTSKDISKQLGLIVVDLIQTTFAFTTLGTLNPIVATLTKAGVESTIEGLSEVAEAVPEQEGLVENPVYTMNEIVRSDLFADNFSAGSIGSFMFSGASVFPDIASQITKNNKKYTQNILFDMMQGPDMGKRYQDLLNSIDVLRIRGTLNEKQYLEAKNTLDFTYSKGREIAVNLTPETRKAILGALSDINIKQQELATLTEPTLIKAKNSEITGLESIVKNLMAGNEPTYFIGNIAYPKDQFEQLIENPEVAAQIINGETTVGVYNDDAVKSKIEALYDTENKNGIQGGIENGQELVEGELDKGAGGEEISPSGVVQVEEGVVEISPEDQEFVDIFEEAKGYTGLRKIEAMDELKTKNSAKFAQVSFIDNNLDVIAEKLNIKKDCK